MKTCCGKPTTLALVAFLSLAGLGLAGAGLVGFVIGGFANRGIQPQYPLTIDATATATGDEFSMATGPVSQDAEGIFVLDHASGLLQCNVLYPRTAQFGAAFTTNVKDALAGGGKNSKFLMVTGAATFPSNSAGGAGNCVVYVLDQSSGAYACYGIPFREAAVNARQPQMGAMILMAVGQARIALDRDALR
jgi:hypothetical protein